jgi:hypothetical protein
MGPLDSDQQQLLYEVRAFARTHPQVLIKSPDECPSGLWEVSLPATSCIAFSDPATMLQCLAFVSIPDEDENDEDEG